MVIGTDCTGSWKSNYHMIMTNDDPYIIRSSSVEVEWVSACCLSPHEPFSATYIMMRVSYIHWNDDDIHFVLRPTCVVGFFIVLGHWNNSPLILVLVDMSLYSEHIILILNKSANTNFIVFGLTWTGLEPMMYYSWGKYATHYTTDVICRSKGKGLTTTNIVMYIVPCILKM